MPLVAGRERVLAAKIRRHFEADVRRADRVLVLAQRVGARRLPAVAEALGECGLERVVIRPAVGIVRRHQSEVRIRQAAEVGKRVVHACRRVVAQIGVPQVHLTTASGVRVVGLNSHRFGDLPLEAYRGLIAVHRVVAALLVARDHVAGQVAARAARQDGFLGRHLTVVRIGREVRPSVVVRGRHDRLNGHLGPVHGVVQRFGKVLAPSASDDGLLVGEAVGEPQPRREVQQVGLDVVLCAERQQFADSIADGAERHVVAQTEIQDEVFRDRPVVLEPGGSRVTRVVDDVGPEALSIEASDG